MNALTSPIAITELATTLQVAAGSMYENNSSGSTITTPSTFTGWISATADAQTTGYVTFLDDNANGDQLVIGASGAGLYLALWKATVNGNNSQTIKGSLFKNASQITTSEAWTTVDTGDTIHTMSGACLITLAAADIIRLKFLVAAGNVVVYMANVVLVRIS